MIPNDVRRSLRFALETGLVMDSDFETFSTWLDSQPVAPEPDWSSAPKWAMWWACDAGGDAFWWESKPIWLANSYFAGWIDKNEFCGSVKVARTVEIPLGCDWRTLIRQRPESDA